MTDQRVKITQLPYEVELDTVAGEPLELQAFFQNPDPGNPGEFLPFDFDDYTVTAVAVKPGRPQVVEDSFTVTVDDPSPGWATISISAAETMALGRGEWLLLLRFEHNVTPGPVCYLQYNWNLRKLGT